MSLCLAQLIAQSVASGIFLTAVVYMLIRNMCKFNKRTKVVLAVLGIAMSLNTASSVLSYCNSLQGNICGL